MPEVPLGIVENIKAQLRKQLGGEPPLELVQQIALKLMAAVPKVEAAKPKFTRDQAHDYWRGVDDVENRPESYINADPKRVGLLLELLGRCGLENPPVLEIGCNVGRNLNGLRQAGYTQLAGIEINQRAVNLLREHFPELWGMSAISVSPVEEAITRLGDDSFDVIFSMAVLVHIHSDSEWVFGEMARVARCNIITIEDEMNVTERHFQRSYREVFEGVGLRQIHEQDCKGIHGLDRCYTARVFEVA